MKCTKPDSPEGGVENGCNTREARVTHFGDVEKGAAVSARLSPILETWKRVQRCQPACHPFWRRGKGCSGVSPLVTHFGDVLGSMCDTGSVPPVRLGGKTQTVSL
jgi:hypothetical protein